MRLSEVLPSRAKFLHLTNFDTHDWYNWLREDVGINYFIRSVDGGYLSPTFWELTRTIRYPEPSDLLKKPGHSGRVTVGNASLSWAKSKLLVRTGAKALLNATYLRRAGLHEISRPSLSCPLPTQLSESGISFLISCDSPGRRDFFLKRLIC